MDPCLQRTRTSPGLLNLKNPHPHRDRIVAVVVGVALQPKSVADVHVIDPGNDLAWIKYFLSFD